MAARLGPARGRVAARALRRRQRYRGVLAGLLLALGGLAPLHGGAAWAEAVVQIDGPAALLAAQDTWAGATVELAPGRYPPLDLGPGEAPALLRSADPARPAELSGLRIAGAEGLRLEDLVLDYRFSPEDPLSVRPFEIRESRDADKTAS